MFAPRYDPWDLFYRKGLKEFLAACGVRGTSWSTQAQDGVLHEVDGVLHEVVGEGPRRIIFDLENISKHENVIWRIQVARFGPLKMSFGEFNWRALSISNCRLANSSGAL